MSNVTYDWVVTPGEKPIVWLEGEIKTPPFSLTALRRLQQGEGLRMPHSRPMPVIGARCHELRINDAGGTWRIIYRIDSDGVLILEVFSKKSRNTPRTVIEACKKRIKDYDNA
jgi:phage-related protein